jgi:hypothetical protein
MLESLRTTRQFHPFVNRSLCAPSEGDHDHAKDVGLLREVYTRTSPCEIARKSPSSIGAAYKTVLLVPVRGKVR